MSKEKVLRIDEVCSIDVWSGKLTWSIVIRLYNGISIYTSMSNQGQSETLVEKLIYEKIKKGKFRYIEKNE